MPVETLLNVAYWFFVASCIILAAVLGFLLLLVFKFKNYPASLAEAFSPAPGSTLDGRAKRIGDV